MVVTLAMRKSESTNSHMQVFSSLARKLDEEIFRQSLLNFQTPEQVTAYLSEQLGLLVSPEPVNSSPSQQATPRNRS
jgi:mannitol/fructose-specific phosphotransferase system IIA component (Ntr-type)